MERHGAAHRIKTTRSGGDPNNLTQVPSRTLRPAKSAPPRFTDEAGEDWEYDRESGKAVRPSTPRPLPGAYR
jgi:hypothetical protein